MGVSYSGEEGGYILEGGVDSGSVAYLGGIYGEGGADSGRTGSTDEFRERRRRI